MKTASTTWTTDKTGTHLILFAAASTSSGDPSAWAYMSPQVQVNGTIINPQVITHPSISSATATRTQYSNSLALDLNSGDVIKLTAIGMNHSTDINNCSGKITFTILN